MAASSSLAATTATLEKKLDAYFQPYVSAGNFSGTVLVARGDRILAAKNYGKANFELETPFTRDSRFHIASITKTFTAAAIEILVERGKLSYGDHLSRWAPSFPSADVITVRQLLLHSSGVPNPDDAAEQVRAPLREAVDALAKKPLWFPPGTASGYSNGGYLVLAFIVEEVSGQRWEDFLASEIVRPLGLTSIQSDDHDSIIVNRIDGYVPGPGKPPIANTKTRMDGAIGSGSLLASARDLYRWGRAFRNETLVKRTKLEYPYGWGVRKYFKRNAIEQSGLSPGFTSYLCVYPDDDLYVVVLSNIEAGLFNHGGIDVAAIALGEKYDAIVTPAPSEMTAADRAAFTGTFTHPQTGMFTIDEAGGALYLHWGHSEDRKYLMPVSGTSVFNREEFSWVERDPAAPDTLTIRWGKEPQTFKRVTSH